MILKISEYLYFSKNDFKPDSVPTNKTEIQPKKYVKLFS